MSQPVLFKYGNTITISNQAVQQGSFLIDYEQKRISIDIDGSNRINLTNVEIDTTLSTTSPNAIANSAITGAIVNTLSEVANQINDYVPCGTKPVREVNLIVGTLASLATTVKTSIVNAINELVSSIGSLASLTTTDKTSTVNAINWIVGQLLPSTFVISFVLNKPDVNVYGQTFKYYTVPFTWADKYYTSNLAVTVIGLGELTGVSVVGSNKTGIQLQDTSDIGNGYPVLISMTMTKL